MAKYFFSLFVLMLLCSNQIMCQKMNSGQKERVMKKSQSSEEMSQRSEYQVLPGPRQKEERTKVRNVKRSGMPMNIDLSILGDSFPFQNKQDRQGNGRASSSSSGGFMMPIDTSILGEANPFMSRPGAPMVLPFPSNDFSDDLDYEMAFKSDHESVSQPKKNRYNIGQAIHHVPGMKPRKSYDFMSTNRYPAMARSKPSDTNNDINPLDSWPRLRSTPRQQENALHDFLRGLVRGSWFPHLPSPHNYQNPWPVRQNEFDTNNKMTFEARKEERNRDEVKNSMKEKEGDGSEMIFGLTRQQ